MDDHRLDEIQRDLKEGPDLVATLDDGEAELYLAEVAGIPDDHGVTTVKLRDQFFHILAERGMNARVEGIDLVLEHDAQVGYDLKQVYLVNPDLAPRKEAKFANWVSPALIEKCQQELPEGDIE